MVFGRRGGITATVAGISALGFVVLANRVMVRHRVVVRRGRLIRGRVISWNRLGWDLMVIGNRHCVLRVAYTLIVLRHAAIFLMHLMGTRRLRRPGKNPYSKRAFPNVSFNIP